MTNENLTWVVVVDGARARILAVQAGDTALTEVSALNTVNRASRDIDADRPGRAFDRTGDGRHAKEPKTDAHRHDKAVFAAEVAGAVNAAAGQGAFGRLVVAAPPAVLGDLRKAFDKQTSARLVAEFDKDLTHVADHELPKHLGDAVPAMADPARGRG